MAADYQLFVNGRLEETAARETFETVDPSTGQPHATVARARAADVERAVAAARAAFEDGRWSGLRPEKRAAVLQAVAGKLKDHAQRLIELEVRDSGGTIRKVRSADVAGAMFTFRTYADFATRIPAEQPLPFTVAPGPSHNYLRREPVGVCGGIIPWNFPIQNAAWKLAPALAAGNTMVLKPAEQTPYTAVELAKLCAEAGVPDGVVNVVPGFGPEAGEPLVVSPEVDKVAFTGSTEVGRRVASLAAGTRPSSSSGWSATCGSARRRAPSSPRCPGIRERTPRRFSGPARGAAARSPGRAGRRRSRPGPPACRRSRRRRRPRRSGR